MSPVPPVIDASDSVPSICAQFSPDAPRRGGAPNVQKIGYEGFDAVIANVKDRFTFTGHLADAVLFDSELFAVYTEDFPTAAL